MDGMGRQTRIYSAAPLALSGLAFRRDHQCLPTSAIAGAGLRRNESDPRSVPVGIKGYVLMRFRQLVLTSGVYGGAELLGRAMQALAILALAGLMPKATFGEVGMLIAVQQMVMALCLGGLVESVSGRLNEYFAAGAMDILISRARIIFWISSAVIVASICVIAGLGLLPVASSANLGALVAAVATGVALAYVQLETCMQRIQERHKSAIGIRVLSQILGFGLGLAATIAAPTPAAFFSGLLLGVICSLAFTYRRPAINDKPVTNGRLCSSTTLWREGAPFMGATLISWAAGYGANFFIFYWLGQESVAEYTLVLSATTALLMVANAVNQVWSPRFLALAREKDKTTIARENLRAMGLLQSLLAATAFATLALFPIVVNLGGANLKAYGSVFDFLAIAFVALVSLTPYYSAMNYYLLHREGPLLARVILVSTMIGIPAWFALVAALGNWGIYVGWSLMTISRGWTVAIVGQKRWGLEVDALRGLLPVLGVALGWAIGRQFLSLV